MLVYVRETELGTVLAPFKETDTPAHLSECQLRISMDSQSVTWRERRTNATETRLDAERDALEAKRREKDEQHLYLTAKIITDEHYSRHEGFDLASFDDKNIPPTELPTFRIQKTETFSTFKQRIAGYFKLPEKDFRLWVLVNRQNKTIRPDVPIHEADNALCE